ncbi:MAG: sugar ABC transporter permease [Clostridia bacterium]
MKKIKQDNSIKGQALSGWLFCMPWIIGFCVLTLYPIIMSLVFSFSDVFVKPSGLEINGVGFSNYIYAIVQDSEFTTVIQQYITKILLYVPVIMVVSLILAMLLNNKLKGTAFFRTIFFLPVIITSGPVIELFISQGVAAFPGIAEMFNFEQMASVLPQFVIDALQFLTSEFIMILWFSGIQILVFMTGLQKIDKNMYEAAAIDGAGAWERFWKITLPAINPTLVINVIFTVVMQSIFSLNPIIIKIAKDMNATGDGAGYGYASAMSWLYFVVLIIILVLFVLIFKAKKKGARQ